MEGSKSDLRAKSAADWVEKEVVKLVNEIERVGTPIGNDQVTVTFGALFMHYQDVSDTLVGMLVRAQKRGIITYEGHGGGLLLQGKHDKVVISLDRKRAAKFRQEHANKPQQQPQTQPAQVGSVPYKRSAGTAAALERLDAAPVTRVTPLRPAKTATSKATTSPLLLVLVGFGLFVFVLFVLAWMLRRR